MAFADITIVPVPSDRQALYLQFSRRMSRVYRDHGATSVVDYWQADGPAGQDDFHAVDAPYEAGELRSIAAAVGARESESVVVTVTEWPSREARDRGTKAAIRDPRVLDTLDEDPVFDGRRLLGASFDIALRLEDRA